MEKLRIEFICPCCKGVGVQKDKFACQAYRSPTWSGKIFQCYIEGRYELDGVHYCGSHLKQALRKQNRLDEFPKLMGWHEQQTKQQGKTPLGKSQRNALWGL